MVNETPSLSEFYAKLLSSTGLIVQPDGAVMIDDGAGPRPLTINGAALVTPTQEVLSTGNTAGKIVFHPLWESHVRKESATFKRLAEASRLRLQSVIHSLMSNLMLIAADPDKHSTLSPEQSMFLSILPEANDKTRESLRKVLNTVGPSKTAKKLITYYVRRPGIWKGNEVRRLVKVSFPLMDEVTNKDKSIFGVTMTQRNKDEIIRLFEFILPDCTNPDTYSYGVDDMLAPNFMALVYAYGAVANRLNHVVDQFRSVLVDAHELYINIDWLEYVTSENISKYRRAAPAFAGNEGETVDGQETTTAPAASAPQINMPTPMTAVAQAVSTQTPAVPGGRMRMAADLPGANSISSTGSSIMGNGPMTPVKTDLSALPKWTDKAAAMVQSGVLRPANPMENALLNNHGAAQVIVVDQNGNPVSVANPQAVAQQAQMQQMQQMYWQTYINSLPSMNINPAAMSQEQLQLGFQMWLAQNGARLGGGMPNNTFATNGTFMGGNNAPMGTFQNTGFMQPNTFGGGNNLMFGAQQHDPFQLPGRAAADQNKMMRGGGMPFSPMQNGFNKALF